MEHSTSSSGGHQQGSGVTLEGLSAWDGKLKHLENAIQEAKEATIGVAKAKRLLKELQAQAAAAKAAVQLELVLSKKPAGAAALKGALAKAEAAATGLSGIGLSGSAVGQAVAALIASARRRLDIERAVDTLAKACASCKAVSDLPKLEAAIINARKVGAAEVDPEVYRHASDQRAQLHDAARVRLALDAAQKAVQRPTVRAEDADVLDKAIQEATKWDDLLSADVVKAREVLQGWRVQTASEAKLAKVLREGTSSAALSRVIADAAAAGVKVQHARRVLKLIQGVEQALSSTGDGTAMSLATIRSRMDAAEQGSVPVSHPVMVTAQYTVKRLQSLDARDTLEAALRQVADCRSWERMSHLKAALDKAEEVVGAAAIASVCQELPVAANGGASNGSRRSSSSTNGATAKAAVGNGSAQETAQAVSRSRSVSSDGKSTSSGGGSPVEGGQRGSGQGTAGQAGVAAGDRHEPEPTTPISVTISEDDADLAMLLELARRAKTLLDEDKREVARLEAERQAERERRDKLERKQRETDAARDDAAKRGRAADNQKRDKGRSDRPQKASKVKVDLASISASPHFSIHHASHHIPPPPPPPPLHLINGKLPPPPPPPPPPVQPLVRADYKAAAEGLYKTAVSADVMSTSGGVVGSGGPGGGGEYAASKVSKVVRDVSQSPVSSIEAGQAGNSVFAPQSPALSATAPLLHVHSGLMLPGQAPKQPGFNNPGRAGALCSNMEAAAHQMVGHVHDHVGLDGTEAVHADLDCLNREMLAALDLESHSSMTADHTSHTISTSDPHHGFGGANVGGGAGGGGSGGGVKLSTGDLLTSRSVGSASLPAVSQADSKTHTGVTLSHTPITGDILSQSSSIFSSATSADDLAGVTYAARAPAVSGQVTAAQPPNSGSRPKYGTVDLGGLSWGVNDKPAGVMGSTVSGLGGLPGASDFHSQHHHLHAAVKLPVNEHSGLQQWGASPAHLGHAAWHAVAAGDLTGVAGADGGHQGGHAGVSLWPGDVGAGAAAAGLFVTGTTTTLGGAAIPGLTPGARHAIQQPTSGSIQGGSATGDQLVGMPGGVSAADWLLGTQGSGSMGSHGQPALTGHATDQLLTGLQPSQFFTAQGMARNNTLDSVMAGAGDAGDAVNARGGGHTSSGLVGGAAQHKPVMVVRPGLEPASSGTNNPRVVVVKPTPIQHIHGAAVSDVVPTLDSTLLPLALPDDLT